MLRVLLVEESPDRAHALREGLSRAGHDVVGAIASPLELLDTIERLSPDVIVIDTHSPTRDAIEHLCVVSQSSPRPIVMFSGDDSSEAIREAVRAGVSAYVVDGLDPARVRPIVEVAVARFEEHQRLRSELGAAHQELAERKLIERAKGILMRTRGLDEQAAYHAMRRMAMDRNKRLAEVARSIIDMQHLLG